MKVEGLTRHNVASHLQVATRFFSSIFLKLHLLTVLLTCQIDTFFFFGSGFTLFMQKYRMQKKHIMQREENPRCTMQTNHLKPIMAYPSYHPNCGISVSAVYPTWRQTNGHPANFNHPPGYRHWPQPGIQPWNSYAGVTFSILRVHYKMNQIATINTQIKKT